MAKTEYSVYSPYYTSDTFGKFLDIMADRTFSHMDDDVTYQIDAVYHNRPDLLAYDLYGNSQLWWVFARRNPNVLKNPLGDFKAGTTIRIPKLSTLSTDLGI